MKPDATIKIWLTVNNDGREFLHNNEPYWREKFNLWDSQGGPSIELPLGTIEKICGHKVTVKDCPVLIEGNKTK